MDIVDTTKEPFYNRGGMTTHNYDGGSRSRDRSSYTVRSPGQEHPERYFSAFHASQPWAYGEKLNYFGGTGGNDACLQPSHSNIAHWGTDETKSWNANMRMEVCQKPIEGMASHTCADQSNRKAARWRPRPCFRALPLTRRQIHRHLFQFQRLWAAQKIRRGLGHALHVLKVFLGHAFDISSTAGTIIDPDVTRFNKTEDPANLAQDWKYEGPVGRQQLPKYLTNNTYYLPQKMPKVPSWSTDDLWDTPAGYDDAYNRHCPYRTHIMGKAVLYMPFNRDTTDYKTFDPAHPTIGNTDAAKFWGKPYWATGAGGAMGCHSPANPPWAFPGSF